MSKRVLVSVNDLPVGSQLRHAVNDSCHVLLVAPGIMIDDRIKQQLIRRGLTHVSIHPDDLWCRGPKKRKKKSRSDTYSDTYSTITERLESLTNSVSVVVRNKDEPICENIVDDVERRFCEQRMALLKQQMANATKVIEQLAEDMLRGSKCDGEALGEITNDGIREMIDDADQTISCTLDRALFTGILERSVRISYLAMAMAIENKYDAKHVEEVGVCALVCDLGLMALPTHLRNDQHPFSKDDWLLYMAHPMKTVHLLEKIPVLSDRVRLAAFQVHEMPDGSGFPRGLRKERTHAYARLISVADAYITLTSQVHGRPALVAHDAILCLLHQINNQRRDRVAVRSLLNVLSLYPIGSRILLSDGSEATVMRRNKNDYMHPIVAREKPNGDQEWFGLAGTSLSIVKPLSLTHRPEMRLDREMMDEFMWQIAPGDWRGPMTP